MATKLTVSAVSSVGTANSGNSDNVTFLVSVTDPTGVGVTGLINSNFLTGTSVHPAGITGTDPSGFSDTGSGTYCLMVKPKAGGKWVAGSYATSIVAGKAGVGNGQTVCGFTIA